MWGPEERWKDAAIPRPHIKPPTDCAQGRGLGVAGVLRELVEPQRAGPYPYGGNAASTHPRNPLRIFAEKVTGLLVSGSGLQQPSGLPHGPCQPTTARP